MKLITTKQAAKILGIKRLGTIYAYIKSGKLRAFRIGEGEKSHWRIDQEDLEKFVKQEK